MLALVTTREGKARETGEDLKQLVTISKSGHDGRQSSIVNISIVADADNIDPKRPNGLAFLDAEILQIQNFALLQDAVDRI